MTFARQIGMMPPQDSTRRTAHDAARSTPRRGSPRGLGAGEAQLVAEGVWVVQGQPGRCNVYLLEDEGGVTLFDAGARTMTRAVASAGAKLGGIRRIVLGHGHTDHRGIAPALGVPVLCHPEEVQDAEGSGGFRYWPEGLAGLPRRHAPAAPAAAPLRLGRRPGEDRGHGRRGRRGRRLPGDRPARARPGQIGAVARVRPPGAVSDCFYTLDMWGRDCAPHVPERDLQLRHRAGAREHPQARRARARGGLARARQAASPATCARSSSGPPTPAERGQARAPPRQRLQRRRSSDYTDAEGNVLTLRGSLTAGSRREYAQASPAVGRRRRSTREDAWQRAVELLFERLAVRWVIAGVPIERPARAAGALAARRPDERAWVREVLREHCAEHFPDVQAP